MTTPVLLHIHVPKCAGSSVNAVFSERLPDRTLTGSPAFLLDVLSAATPEENDRRYDAVVGHFFWGLHKYFTRPPRYFSVVRDPVERICSFFNYIHVTETHGLHRYLKENLTDLNDISERLLDDSPALREQWDNYACRAYTGIPRETQDFDRRVRQHVKREILKGRLVLGDVAEITAYLARQGILPPGSVLPRVNVGEDIRRTDFVPARADALRPSARRVLRRMTVHDYGLLRFLGNANLMAKAQCLQ